MKRILLLLPILAIAACSRYEGPREVYQKTRQGDRADPRDKNGNPEYSIEEQQQRGRERYPLFEDGSTLGPNTYITRPGIGR